MESNVQNSTLFDDFIHHFQKVHFLPPLSAKILTLIVLDGFEKGFTFEDLLELTGASKSSVSQSLNSLLEQEKIHFEMHEGCRKKHFKPRKINELLSQFQDNLEYQNRMMDKMICYRHQQLQGSDQYKQVEITKIFQEHIQQMSALVANTIERIRAVEKSMETNKN